MDPKTNPHPKTRENDVDLGLVIYKTGNLVSNFFVWLGRIFTAIGNFILHFLFFLRRNLLWLIIGTAIGFCYGLYLYVKKGPTYISEMTVRTNFNSSRALYSTAEFMNSLIAAGMHEELAKLLNISAQEASTLLNFHVTPVKSDLIVTQIYKDQFLDARKYNSSVRMDTFWTRTVKYTDFKESLTDYDFPLHTISMSSSSPVIFPKVQSGVINYVSQIQLLQQIRDNQLESNKEEVNMLLASIRSLDSLSQSYNKRLVNSSAGATPGNSVTLLSGPTYQSPELELYDKLLQLKDELKRVRNETAIEKNIVEIYSPFNPFGRKESFFKQKMVLHTIIGFVLTLILLVVIKIYRQLRYLEQNEKSKRAASV